MLKMGYQMVRVTEDLPENTLWYCRYCGGGMAVSGLSTALNHEAGKDKGDAVFNEAAVPEAGKSLVKLKITETHHLVVTYCLIEHDTDEGAEPEVLSALFSD